MITVERTVRVARPVGVVFNYLTDFTHTEQWDPGTVTTTRTDNGPLEVGARFHNVSQFRGRRTELEYELTRRDPDAHLVFTGHNGTVTSTDDMSFSSDGTTTALTYRATLRFKGLFRLAEPFLRSGFEKVADETADQLRTTLESLPS